jgi:hypothetical protein
MYGLINIAIRDLVKSKFSEQQWDQIFKQSGATDAAFIRMCPGDDATTYALVGAASDVLGLPASEILQAFGEYWTEFTADEGYGPLLDAAGSTLPEFLQNLDQLHTRVGMMYPDLKPPSFVCSEIADDSLMLHYKSGRDGLDDLVIGLLRGLGRRFKVDVKIEQVSSKEDTGLESVFHVNWS